jgi:ribose 5-phosphate isomerase A
MRLNLPFLLLEEVLSGAWRQVWGQLGEMGDTAKLGMNVRLPCPVGTDQGNLLLNVAFAGCNGDP